MAERRLIPAVEPAVQPMRSLSLFGDTEEDETLVAVDVPLSFQMVLDWVADAALTTINVIKARKFWMGLFESIQNWKLFESNFSFTIYLVSIYKKDSN